MELIELARQMGRKIQEDERFIAMQMARQNCDEDKSLQDAIGEFNLKKMQINNETQKQERDQEKIKKLNEEFGMVYSDILKNENMTKYNQAKTELDAMIQRINGIISLCAEGEDPESCDYNPSSCGGGDCSGCSGCN